MKFLGRVLFSISILSTTACELGKTSTYFTGPSGSGAILPAVSITCSGTNCSNGNADGKTFYIYWDETVCLTPTSSYSSTSLATATGIVSCSGGTCTGAATTYSAKIIPITNYTTIDADLGIAACGFIDIDGDGLRDFLDDEPDFTWDDVTQPVVVGHTDHSSVSNSRTITLTME